MIPAHRIICIGGWGSTKDVWINLARALPEFRLEPIPWWKCLDPGVGALRTALAAGRPALVVGWSLGGLALLRTLQEGIAGEIPACLLASTARMTADDGYPGTDPRALRAMRMRLSRDPDGVMADFVALCGAPSPPGDFVARYVARSRAIPPGMLAAGLSFLADTDLRAGLPHLDSPLLWLHGEADAVIPVDSARDAAAYGPSIRLETIPGVGHSFPMTHTLLVADRIRRWLA
ncbi:MAG TPA: alpha/beta fold hydrolase [Candidatus Deferrimicrobiaceae bacterium]